MKKISLVKVVNMTIWLVGKGMTSVLFTISDFNPGRPCTIF